MKEFMHLRVHSSDSLSDGTMSEEEIIKKAKENGQTSVAITDLDKMYNAINFYQKAREAGIKPILGMDAHIETDITNPEGYEDPVRVLLLAKNENGYKEIVKLSTRANLENLQGSIPFIKQSWLKDGIKDVIALSGDDLSGELAINWLSAPEDKKRETIKTMSNIVSEYKKFFPDGYFIETQRNGRDNEHDFVRGMLNISAVTEVPLVATHSVQFANREDYAVHEIRRCIGKEKYVDSFSLESNFTREQYFKSTEEMHDMFSDIPNAIENNNAIAKLCNVNLDLKNEYHLPDYPTPNGENIHDYINKIALENLNKKMESLIPDDEEREAKYPEYLKRLNYELDIIKNMNFSGYFMIVSDFINWAKNNDISVGPGRGSGAGSLVALALDIIEVDPIKHGLLFERFLNPERNSMPDFDIDFDSANRKRVIEYVTNKYNDLSGGNAVAQIATKSMEKTRSSLQDVGKILQSSFFTIKAISEFVKKYNEEFYKDPQNLMEAVEYYPDFKKLYNEDREIRKLVNYADKINGIPKAISKHASGIIIAKNSLEEYTPLFLNEGNIVTQFDNSQIEKVGLVKFDFLGVSNLDFVKDIVAEINKRPDYEQRKFDIKDISFSDVATYNTFKNGDTTSVFQFESSGMQKTLRKMKADKFEDLVAAIALFRPGPKAFIDNFAMRKEGKEKADYIHPLLEEVSKDTHGIMIYQEQVMKAAQVIAGYTLGGADKLRRAMGKKEPEVMKAHRKIFVDGALKTNNIDSETSNKIFDVMEKFAEYGFNKSHSVAYAILSYRNAYLKTHFPEEFFMAALKHTEKKKLGDVFNDIYSHGFKLSPPDVNKSDITFSSLGSGSKIIRFGLSNISDVSDNIAEKIIKARKEKGEFKDIFDFCEKVGRDVLTNNKTFEVLISSGSLDSIIENRNELLVKSNIDKLLTYTGKSARKNKDEGFVLNDIFGKSGLIKNAVKPYKMEAKEVERPSFELDEDDVLVTENDLVDKEVSALSICLSRSPMKKYEHEFNNLEAITPLRELERNNNGMFAGVVIDINKYKTKATGKEFSVLKITDGFLIKEILAFDQTQEQLEKFKEGDFISFERKLSKDQDKAYLVKAYDLEETRKELASVFHLAMRSSDVPDLMPILKQHKGGTTVRVYVPEEGTERYNSATLNRNYNVNITPECIKDLEAFLGADKVKITYKRNFSFKKFKPQYKAKKNANNGGYDPNNKDTFKKRQP